jgi:hypothetical protein
VGRGRSPAVLLSPWSSSRGAGEGSRSRCGKDAHVEEADLEVAAGAWSRQRVVHPRGEEIEAGELELACAVGS